MEKDDLDIAINDEGTQISITRRGRRSFQKNLILGSLLLETKLSDGLFHKVFWIPNGVDVDRIWAKIEDDREVLSIYMPKFSIRQEEEESKDTDQESILSGSSDDEEFEEARDEEFVQDTGDSERQDNLKPEQLDFKEIEIEETLVNSDDEDYLDVDVCLEKTLEMKDEEENMESEELQQEEEEQEEIPLTPDKDHEQVKDFNIEEIQKEVENVHVERCKDDSNKTQEENQCEEVIEPKKEDGIEEPTEKNPNETQEPILNENEEIEFSTTQQEEYGEPEEIPSPSDHHNQENEASSTLTHSNDPFVDDDEDKLPQPKKLQKEESTMPTPENESLPNTIQEKEEKPKTIDLDQGPLEQQEEPHENDISTLRPADTKQEEDHQLSKGKETKPKDSEAAEMVKPTTLEEDLDECAKLNGDNGGWPSWGWRGKRRPQLTSSSLLMGSAFILSLSVLMLHLMKKGKNQQ